LWNERQTSGNVKIVCKNTKDVFDSKNDVGHNKDVVDKVGNENGVVYAHKDVISRWTGFRICENDVVVVPSMSKKDMEIILEFVYTGSTIHKRLDCFRFDKIAKKV
jgi:hypothetical protein